MPDAEQLERFREALDASFAPQFLAPPTTYLALAHAIKMQMARRAHDANDSDDASEVDILRTAMQSWLNKIDSSVEKLSGFEDDQRLTFYRTLFPAAAKPEAAKLQAPEPKKPVIAKLQARVARAAPAVQEIWRPAAELRVPAYSTAVLGGASPPLKSEVLSAIANGEAELKTTDRTSSSTSRPTMSSLHTTLSAIANGEAKLKTTDRTSSSTSRPTMSSRDTTLYAIKVGAARLLKTTDPTVPHPKSGAKPPSPAASALHAKLDSIRNANEAEEAEPRTDSDWSDGDD